jgi:hypothetical protein
MNLLLTAVVALTVLALVLVGLARHRRQRPGRGTPTPPPRLEPKVVETRDDPDEPIPFGPKSLWVAARAPSAQALAEALELDDLRASNWSSGLAAAEAYPSHCVFVTPPIRGWILAVGVGLPDPGDSALLPRWRSLMSAVSQRFGEAWFFGNHRISSYSVWACYVAGRERRLFAYADGQLIYDFGEPLAEEVNLVRRRRDLTTAGSDRERGGAVFEPDEDDVLRLAGACTIDPSTIDPLDTPPGVGLVGEMPGDPRVQTLQTLRDREAL